MTTPSVEDIERMIRVASQFSEFTCRSEPLLPVLELARKAAALIAIDAEIQAAADRDDYLAFFDDLAPRYHEVYAALLADPDTGERT